MEGSSFTIKAVCYKLIATIILTSWVQNISTKVNRGNGVHSPSKKLLIIWESHIMHHIPLTSQSFYILPLTHTPTPTKKSTSCCPYIHWNTVIFLVFRSLKGNEFSFACICTRSYQLRRALVCLEQGQG